LVYYGIPISNSGVLKKRVRDFKKAESGEDEGKGDDTKAG
jgi:hypothetical protein